MMNAEFEEEKLNGTNNFGMWKCKFLYILFQQELQISLEKDKSEYMMKVEWHKVNRLTCGQLCRIRQKIKSILWQEKL